MNDEWTTLADIACAIKILFILKTCKNLKMQDVFIGWNKMCTRFYTQYLSIIQSDTPNRSVLPYTYIYNDVC